MRIANIANIWKRKRIPRKERKIMKEPKYKIAIGVGTARFLATLETAKKRSQKIGADAQHLVGPYFSKRRKANEQRL